MYKITANKAGTACYENCHFKILYELSLLNLMNSANINNSIVVRKLFSLRFKRTRLSFHGISLKFIRIDLHRCIRSKHSRPTQSIFLDHCV